MAEYACKDPGRRREDVAADGRFNGIDDIEVDGGHSPHIPVRRTLLVRCLLAVPHGVSVEITGGVRADPAINPVRVLWAYPALELSAAHETNPLVSQQDADVFSALPDPGRLLVVRTSSSGDFSEYRLMIKDPPKDPAGSGFDPRLAEAPFVFAVDNDIDCPHAEPCVPLRAAEPDIDYRSRDYAGLRAMLLDRLATVIPQWRDRGAADIGVMLVELLAYLGDRLAYAQDAVSAEAYLGTARRRVSVARHARMLDYRMHQGAAARCWLAINAEPVADGWRMPAGQEVRSADGSLTFRTLHDADIRTARNEIDIYTWGNQQCWLPKGATAATLAGSAAELGLAAGDVLLFEESQGPGGKAPDLTHRWAVRLSGKPQETKDPVTKATVLEVTWHPEDALPFPLCAWRISHGRCLDDEGSAVVRGNVVLAEHGGLVGPEPVIPAQVPAGRYRPALAGRGLTYAVPYDDAQARARPAAAALDISPADAQPQVCLDSDRFGRWVPHTDLLRCDRFQQGFVVETDDDGSSWLRFGDDILGRRPVAGDKFSARYRVGVGPGGNCGPESLTELVISHRGVSVRNPLAARGGADPEPAERVRQLAPQAFRVQQRAVTGGDYEDAAQRDPRVQRAAATRRWTGSWYTEFVAVDARAGLDPEALRTDLARQLDRYRMAGTDVEIDGPVLVPLDIVLTVCAAPGYIRPAVESSLADLFSATDLPGGRRGYFHPDNFTFGQPVYLSRIVAAAASAEGVAWVDTEERPGEPNRFRRWGRADSGERAAGRISMGRLEVAQCDSDPSRPENGRIAFNMVGGVP